MKKIYISTAVFLIAILANVSSFAQGLTVDTYEGKAWPWEVWGDVAQGDTIRVKGSYTTTVTENDTVYDIQKVQLALLHLDGTTWGTVYSYNAIIADTAYGNLSSGIIDNLITVPANFPLTSTDEAGHWLLQTRIYYGRNGKIIHRGKNPVNGENSILDQYSNAWVTIIEGTPAEVPDGLTVFTYEGKAWPWEVWGDVQQGGTIHVDGTYSQTVMENDTVYDIQTVELSFLHLDGASWATIHSYTEVTAKSLGNNEFWGDMAGGIINNDITVPADFPLTSTDEAGHWLLQTRLYYGLNGKIVHRGKNPVTGETSILDQYSNAWVTIVAGTTGIKNNILSSDVNVFPNPVSKGKLLHVKANELSGDVNVRMINLLGCEVYHKVMSANDISIETDNMVTGIYFVNLSQGNKSVTKKVAVQ